MRPKKALWDGSDPLYAPFITWSGKNPSHRYAHWKCPARYVKHGYAIKSVILEPGLPDDEHQFARAARCRELTIDLLNWWEEKTGPKTEPGTWAYLIGRYETDPFSPIREVKGNTRDGYIFQINLLRDVIGHMQISELTYVQIKTVQKVMQDKGRSVAYVHRFFNTLRRVARYGKALGIKEAAEVAMILSEMRFPTSPARQIAPTREQVYAIIAAADAEGLDGFAAGIMMQYEFALRAVDVRGQWIATDKTEGGIIRNGKRWQDGLTWDMFDTDLTQFEKIISKTAKSLPEPYTFDLTLLPELRARLRLLRPESPVGPVIRSSRKEKLPYTVSGWSQAWSRMRTAAGLPENIWMMDTRAGAVTEAKMLGADPFALRDAAQHSNISTTNRYGRDRSAGANNVVKIRRK